MQDTERIASAATQRVRIAAMGDIHCAEACAEGLGRVFARAAAAADVLLLCGDLTDYGLPREARLLAEALQRPLTRIPVLGVLGNHDFESGQADTVARILEEAGVIMLDGTAHEIHGIGFTGVKGFVGGFRPHALGAWGEASIKLLVQDAKQEALKLERGLAALPSTATRIVLLHYAPISETVEGESVQAYAFLGSSHLEPPLDHYGVTAVFHGHAHRGRLEGRTEGNVPVYNVSMHVLSTHRPEAPPFRVLEVDGAGGSH